MDPVTLIVTALAAGAASALQDGAAAAVKDAYARLKALVKKRFAGRPEAVSWCWPGMRLPRKRGKRRWLLSCPRQAQIVMPIWWLRRRH